MRGIAATVCAAGIDESVSVLRDIGGAYAVARRNRERIARATSNLTWCFPDWPADRVHNVAVESYRNLFGLAAEVCYSPRMFEGEGWPERIILGESPLVQQAIDMLIEGRPSAMITGHCGNWEVLGLTIAHFGFNLHALYRPLDLKPVDTWVRQTRGRNGLFLIDKFGASEQLPAIIKRHENLGFIADQNAGSGGVHVPFFGRLASTYKSIGLIAMRFELPMLCGHATRIRHPETEMLAYRIDVVDIIHPHEWAEQPDPLFYISARYRRAIEKMVSAAPEQYLWMHRYWKSRPKFEKRGKPAPESLLRKIRELPWMTDEEVDRIRERSNRDAKEAAAGR
jgi:KDO2-lipid IV(A) lauroyltransferase